MANFEVSNTAPPQWIGGPATHCSICKFENNYPWYVTALGVMVEEPQPVMNGMWTDRQFVLCSDHATELKEVLDEVLPDPRLPKLQGQALKAEAARARAEKRADAAEKALHAMQDWMAEGAAK